MILAFFSKSMWLICSAVAGFIASLVYLYSLRMINTSYMKIVLVFLSVFTWLDVGMHYSQLCNVYCKCNCQFGSRQFLVFNHYVFLLYRCGKACFHYVIASPSLLIVLLVSRQFSASFLPIVFFCLIDCFMYSVLQVALVKFCLF